MVQCTACRVRHLTCDQQTICSECRNSGRECIRGYNIRYRHLVCPDKRLKPTDHHKYEFAFDEKQTWLHIDGDVTFVTHDDAETTVCDVNTDLPAQLGMPDEDLRESLAIANTPPATIGTDEWTESAHRAPTHNASFSPAIEGAGNDISTQAPSTSLTTPISLISNPSAVSEWPLSSLREAKLLQHFVTHLAPWFDLGDCKRHFGKVASCMAAGSPLLANAMLAIAALHEARINGRRDPQEAIAHHDKCVSILVPMLDDGDRTNDDYALMTIIILHLYEDIDTGNDSRRHLQATSVFYPPNASSQSSHLRKAVFWIHLRQEVYNAYIQQRSARVNLDNCEFETPGYLSNDDFWFHQTLWIAAQVSQWAFGEDPSLVRWHELSLIVNEWEDQRPATFDPIYFRPREPKSHKYFPEVCYSNDEHVASAHFLYLARLLLTTHDPTLPRIGPRLKAATQAMRDTALSFVRTLVGVAVCNNFVPARFSASLAIIICGGWFTDREEQEQLILFMRETDKCSGLPRKKAELALIEEWEWSHSE